MAGTANAKYYLVDAEALPDILLKVMDAKSLLVSGEASTVAEAVRAVGISRSAFYKYKDAASPFFDMHSGRIITFHIMMKNQPGVLSSVLAIFAKLGANILTINQSLPSDGCAIVSISTELSGRGKPVDELLTEVPKIPGVVKIEIPAG